MDEFWSDAILAEDPDYFIGSFVLYQAKGDPDLLFIVDGQQRLTTITLLLSATRDALHNLGFNSLAAGLQKLIEREDINSELRFVLDSETPYPYLQEHIQKYEEKEKMLSIGPEQEALKAAFDFLSGQIQKSLEAIEIDTTIANDKKQEAKKKKLLDIRDKILRLQLITVKLGTEDDAYLIFETLNTRGKDLTVADLVKNHLTRLLKPKHKGVDTAKDKWNKICDLFYKSESSISVNRFIHHFWLSRNSYTTVKKLFKEIKKSVKKESAKEFLALLVSDAYLYRQILDPSSHKWTKEELRIADSIAALNVFKVVQPIPMILSILREYRAKTITIKQIKQTFQSMENFHCKFTGVTSQRTGGGTALMYASSARQLLEAKSNNDKGIVVKEFVGKLRSRVPGYEEFEAAFIEIQFTNDNARQRSFVRYLLRRIDEHHRSDTIPDYNLMTIEHLASQNISGSTVSKESIGMMGNLIFVTEKQNTALGTKKFKEKMEILRRADVPLDSYLESAEKWSNKTITERTKSLSKLCYEKIFKV